MHSNNDNIEIIINNEVIEKKKLNFSKIDIKIILKSRWKLVSYRGLFYIDSPV